LNAHGAIPFLGLKLTIRRIVWHVLFILRLRRSFLRSIAIVFFAGCVLVGTDTFQHANVAAAQHPGDIQLFIPHCETPSSDPDKVIEILKAELAPNRVFIVHERGKTEVNEDESSALWLDACAQNPSVDIGIVQTNKLMITQTVDLSDVPVIARHRTLALALAELYRSAFLFRSGDSSSAFSATFNTVSAQPIKSSQSDAERKPMNQKKENSKRIAASKPLAEKARLKQIASNEKSKENRALYRPGWTAAFASRYFIRRQTPLWGAALGLRFNPFHLGIVAIFNQRSSDLGAATYGAALGTMAYDLWFIGDAISVTLRPRFEIGPAFAWGAANERASSSTTLSVQIQGLVEIALRAPIVYGFELEIAALAGVAQGLSVQTGDREIASTHGFFFGANAGIESGL